MATISFWADNTQIPAGSGLGFFGDAGFGASISVGGYNSHTFLTNGAGTVQSVEANNVKWLNTASGILGQVSSGTHLLSTPNAQATLNVRFEHGSAVKAQNGQIRIYDRSNINNLPTGVTTAVAEIIHPDPVQNYNGSGDATWQFPGGSGSILSLAPSPGVSGLYAGNGSDSVRADTRHDWYLAISASPNVAGSITLWGLFFELEYI